MRPALLGIRHVALVTSDLAASERFWVEIMGYTVEWRPDPDNVYLSSGADNLALHRAAGDSRGPGALDHFGLAVREAADVDAWAVHLRGRGIGLEREPTQHRDGSRSLYLREPGGVLVQIIHHGPISK